MGEGGSYTFYKSFNICNLIGTTESSMLHIKVA